MVFFFHRRMITGRSRFAKNITTYFAQFLAAYKDSAGAWEAFLTDKGVGSPPVEYNMYLEDGLRLILFVLFTYFLMYCTCMFYSYLPAPCP